MPRLEPVVIDAPCSHVEAVRLSEVTRPTPGCEECLKTGSEWVHLRICLSCGHVGCCDSSPGKHATKHYRVSSHPIVTSAEVGETWSWCFVHEREIGP